MKRMFLLLGIAFAAVALAGCAASGTDHTTGPDFELKMYKVPAAQSKAIASNLEGILASAAFQVGRSGHTTMRATAPFPGTVLVLAPKSVQPSIATAIAALDKAAGAGGTATATAKASVRGPLRIHFWVVQAKAGSGSDSPILQPLEPTLKRLRGSLPAGHFTLMDNATVVVNMLGQNPDVDLGNARGSVITGRGDKFSFQATAVGTSNVSLNIGLDGVLANGPFRKFETVVTVQLGTYVVLAEASPAHASNSSAAEALMNLLVVRVDRVSPAAT